MKTFSVSPLILLCALFLAGCGQTDYAGDVAGTEQNPGDNTGKQNTDEAARQAAIERGEVLWAEKNCDTCHGETGDGEPKGSSILASLSSASVNKLIVNTMPLGNAGSCDAACASDIVAYISAVNGLNYQAPPAAGGGGTSIIDGRITLDAAAHQKRLYKAALNLVSRLPTQQERDLVLQKGDAGFTQAVTGMMEETAFYERLREIYQPLLVDPGAPQVGNFLTMFGSYGRWAFDVYASSRARALYANGLMTTGLNQEPMRLIEYIVKENRPYTEILTADYTMVNYFSARAYNKHEQLTFRHLTNPKYADIPWDPEHYVPVRFTEIPQAGLLTQMHFLKTYPTTATNVNRHRAYMVFKLFLDTDLLEIDGSRTLPDDILVDDPTRNSPSCTGCHQIMDPVASTFRHWQLGTVRRSNLNQAKWDQSTILMPGFNGQEMDANNPAPLVWLGKEIAKDPRFARATVKTFFTEMTGAALLEVPAENSPQAAHALYDFQQQVINDLAAKFIASGYNFKSLIVNLLATDYFNDQDFVGGSSRLLPAQRLVRKLQATTGQGSFSGSNLYLNASIYAGEQPSGTMALIQRLTASSVACKSITPDIAKPAAARLLLPHYVAGESLTAGSAQALTQAFNHVDKNIQNLMWVLWGETVDLQNEQLLELREIYLAAVSAGVASSSSTSLDSTCRSNNISTDADYQLRGWIMLINLMIDDFRFYYE
ncbi:MAG: c-type cytochrome [Oceanospirillaceae bacterium]|nr:c-type cytochrome [Oceanospirillaceae bacterium]MCP5350119.1 c-type cytochrome [Oceanospirillaceae bacterium]